MPTRTPAAPASQLPPHQAPPPLPHPTLLVCPAGAHARGPLHLLNPSTSALAHAESVIAKNAFDRLSEMCAQMELKSHIVEIGHQAAEILLMMRPPAEAPSDFQVQPRAVLQGAGRLPPADQVATRFSAPGAGAAAPCRLPACLPWLCFARLRSAAWDASLGFRSCTARRSTRWWRLWRLPPTSASTRWASGTGCRCWLRSTARTWTRWSRWARSAACPAALCCTHRVAGLGSCNAAFHVVMFLLQPRKVCGAVQNREHRRLELPVHLTPRRCSSTLCNRWPTTGPCTCACSSWRQRARWMAASPRPRRTATVRQLVSAAPCCIAASPGRACLATAWSLHCSAMVLMPAARRAARACQLRPCRDARRGGGQHRGGHVRPGRLHRQAQRHPVG